jgi:hypothetical protein
MSSTSDKSGGWKDATPAHPCPICEHKKYCRISTDGAVALCRFESADGEERRDKNGELFWLHRLGPSSNGDWSPQPKFSVADGKGQRADPETLDWVYRAVLKHQPLMPAHREQLQRRCLSDDEINRGGYRSLCKQRVAACRAMLKEDPDLEQHLPRVPGFQVSEKDGHRFWSLSGESGLLIPVSDAEGRIVALMVRPDEPCDGGKYRWLSSGPKGGAAPGRPTHVPVGFGGDRTTVGITEGVLKADVATLRTGLLTIGLPGANAWPQAAQVLQALGAKTARLLYDADCRTICHVAESLHRLAPDLKAKGYAVEMGVWDLADGKGIDDLVVAGKSPTVLTGDAAFAAVAQILDEARPLGRPAAPTGLVPVKRPPRLPPYQPFPADSLPEPLRAFVVQGAAALGCDVAYLALPALALCGGLVGYTRVLRLKRSWRAPAVFWTLVIADSGSLKSPAFRLVTDYVFALQRGLDQTHRQEVTSYQTKKREWERATRKWERWDRLKKKPENEQAPPLAGPKPEDPVPKSIFTSNATIEALAELLGDNPRGLPVIADELVTWLGSFTKYRGKACGSDLQHWLSLHSAGGFAYHRKTGNKRRIVVEHAAVSVTGGVQPGVLTRAMSDEFLAAGLLARILLAMPPRPVKQWTEVEVAPETEEGYHRLLDGLLALGFGSDSNGQSVPAVLSLSREAKTLWIEWYERWAKEQAAAEGELAAAFSKLEEAAGRFALLHHVIGCAGRKVEDSVPVEAESVRAGVVLARWFAAEARRVYQALAESAEDRATRRLVEFVQARGGLVSVKELHRSNQRKYGSADAAEADLQALVEAGLATWQNQLPGAKGGRPTRVCVLSSHNVCDESDETFETDPVGDGGESLPAGSGVTKPPQSGDDTPENPGVGGVSSVLSHVTREADDKRKDPGDTPEGFVTPGEVSSHKEDPPDAPETQPGQSEREPGEEG